MKERSLRIFVIMSIFTTQLLSSCSIGVECGLIGKWEYFDTIDGVDITTTVEFTSDDKIIVESFGKKNFGGVEVNSSLKYECTINSVENHTIEYSYEGIDYEMKYRNLACDSVEINDNGDGWMKFTRVY